MTSRRVLLAVASVVLLVGIGAVVRRLLAPSPAAPYVEVLDVPLPEATPPEKGERFEPRDSGGTYAGVVVGPGDQPVRDADVLLVGLDADAKMTMETANAQGETTHYDLPIYGEYHTIARMKTGVDGKFALSAGAGRVLAIVAYERAFSPAMLAHTPTEPLKAGPDHVIRLFPAGRLDGQVLDAVTHEPVGGADVAIFFQQPSNQEGRPGPAPTSPRSSFGVFVDYVERVLGPMIWGIGPPRGDTGFHLTTTADGRFSFGPVMQEVQVEIIVTHLDYMWTDNDEDVVFESDQQGVARASSPGPLARKRRTVVPAGRTVERTIHLQRGQEVKGRVVDAAEQPIQDVVIALEHLSQYSQHWWYRVKARTARTDRQGRFRIAGLAQPPYNLQMTHPSFDTEWFSGVKAGSDEVYKVQAGGGWLDLLVEGGPEGIAQWSGRAIIESGDRKSTLRQEPVIVRDRRARIERLKPGRYAVTLVSGTSISSTAYVEVKSGDATTETVKMEVGGGIRLPVRDAGGKPLDPATVELEIAGGGEQAGRRAAMLVARAGLASTDGLLAGRYVATVSAPGYVPVSTEPFDVAPSRATTLPAVVLRRQAYLRITGVVDENGRPVSTDTTISVAEGGGEPQRRRTQQAGLLPVTPGSVMLLAENVGGGRFEQTLDVAEGVTLPVEIRLAR